MNKQHGEHRNQQSQLDGSKIFIVRAACPKIRVSRSPYNDGPYWVTSVVDIYHLHCSWWQTPSIGAAGHELILAAHKKPSSAQVQSLQYNPMKSYPHL